MNRAAAFAALALITGSAACFSPTFDNPTCGPNGECPSGFTCVENVCRSSGSDIDAPSGGGDAIDAPIDSPTDGMSGVCGPELMCPPPGSGTTICGRLWDAEADQPIAAEGVDPTMPCTGTPTMTGPCSIRLRFFDAFAYLNDPMGATPLMPGNVIVDGCGRFRADNIPSPPVGVIAVATDDPPGVPVQVPHRLTGITVRTSTVPVEQTRAFATRVSTDNLWSSTAGLPLPSFADRGVDLFVFRYHDTPRPGVMVRRQGVTIPNEDYYFNTPGSARTNVSPADNVTGPNGSALVTGMAGLTSYDGQGNEPPGCTWKSVSAAVIQGSVLFQYIDAVDPAGNACP